jgi:hypothetical protein
MVSTISLYRYRERQLVLSEAREQADKDTVYRD